MYYMMAASVGAHATFNLTIPASFVRESHDSRLRGAPSLLLQTSFSLSLRLIDGSVGAWRPARQSVTSTCFVF